MSGICGIINFDGAPVNSTLLKKMADASNYRGPDGIHYWIDGNVGVAHLAHYTTPEAKHENQPLVSESGAHVIVMVADARVDNREELIRTLSVEGCLRKDFYTDADLIMASYRCWGKECPAHLYGDFAFAIWDSTKKELFCARDVIGTRPFYYFYSTDRKSFLFASDINQILTLAQISFTINGYYLADYLLGDLIDPAYTICSQISSLPPANNLYVSDNGLSFKKYWHPENNPPVRFKQDDEYIDYFRELFSQSVSDRLRSSSGVVAVDSSGGLDSSSVAAFAQHLFNQGKSNTLPISFTYVFDQIKECDDREYTKALSIETGLELHEIVADRFYFLDDDHIFRPRISLPIPFTESMYSYHLKEVKANHADVFLNGHGGNELFFAGRFIYYDYVRKGHLIRLLPWLIAERSKGASILGLLYSFFAAPLLPKGILSAIAQIRRGYRSSTDSWIHPWLVNQARIQERHDYKSNTSNMYHDFAMKLHYNALVKIQKRAEICVNINWRANEYGLEPRFPFYDRRIIEFILTAPLDLGYRPGIYANKWLLRQSMAGILPDKLRLRQGNSNWNAYYRYAIFDRPYQEFVSHFFNMLSANLQFVLQDKLLETYQSCYEIKSCSSQTFIFPLFVERWLRQYLNIFSGITFS